MDDTPSIRITGTDEYSLVLDGHHIHHHVNVDMGGTRVESMELITLDPSTGSWKMRSFDNEGSFTTMECTLEAEGTLRIIGEGMRAVLNTEADGERMIGHWERAVNGEWLPWMNVVLTRSEGKAK